MKRPFASLSPLEALRAAIGVERRNTDLYRNLADTFQSYNSALAEVFNSMALEEDEHRVALESYLRNKFPGESADTLGAEVDEVIEAPDLPDAESFIFDDDTVQRAIEVAEQTEALACEFYRRMARQVKETGLRSLCEHMAEVEAGHRETFTRWKKY